MGNIIRNLGRTALILAGLPIVGLAGYDLVSVRPRLAQVEKILESASAQDANPPPLIRKMIDANSSDPASTATMNVVWRVYPQSSNLRWHMRNALWRLLLPLHLGQDGMYGLYATLSFNGVDHGLNNYAEREFGAPLDKLTATQAATTVAITHFPSRYSKDRESLDNRAAVLLRKSGVAP